MPASLNQLDERQSAAIQDRNFQVVDLNEGVIDSHAVQHAQQVLCRGNQYALAHQAGRVADSRDMSPTGWNGEILQIGAFEKRCLWMGGGQDTDVNRNAAMKTYAADASPGG